MFGSSEIFMILKIPLVGGGGGDMMWQLHSSGGGVRVSWVYYPKWSCIGEVPHLKKKC
jgi:hypothetical protein